MDPAELADWMMKLQAAGCHNINFVTPEHVAPQVGIGRCMDSWQLARLHSAAHQILCGVTSERKQVLSPSTFALATRTK